MDTVQGDEREQARFSEVFIAVLLQLDAVSGHYPAVRDTPACHRPWSWHPRCRRLGYGVLLEPLAE